MSTATTAGYSRRGFLGMLGVSAATIAIGTSLTGCGPSAQGGNAAASASVKLPTYKEFTGIKPDLPGNAEGLQPAFLSMPKNFIKTTSKAPLTQELTAYTETFATPPPGMNSNAFWKRLNTALGANLNLTIGTDPGYPDKFATILASGDLPDLMWLPPNQGIPNIGPMLEAKFTDMTTYLSGDAVLQYPNLAALKPASWKTAVVNGKIWGAPIPSTPMGQVMIGNPEMWSKVGGFKFTSVDDFMAKGAEVAKAFPGSFVLGSDYINELHMFGEWFGVPTTWRLNKDRTLTHMYETPEYKAMLEFAAKVFKAGFFNPDTTLSSFSAPFVANKLAAYVSVGPKGISEPREADPTRHGEVLIPFGHDGRATPVYDMGYGTVGFTPLKKTTDEKRIREVLDFYNWMAAPFGSAEYLQKNYGTEGADFTFDQGGNPVFTKDGNTNAPGLVSALNIMSSPENPIYSASFTKDTQAIYDASKELLKYASRNPTAGTYSDTNSKLGGKLTTAARDTATDILTGRAGVDTWDAAVTKWKNGGGDKIREEYQKALA